MQCRLLSLQRASVRSSARRACSPRPRPQPRPLLPQTQTQTQAARHFHATRPHANLPQDPHTPPTDPSINSNAPELTSNAETAQEKDATITRNDVETKQKQETGESSGKKDFKPYGSALRRAMRNRKAVEERKAPTPVIPSWFRERNIDTSEDLRQLADTRVQSVAVGQFSPDVEELIKGVSQGGEDGDDKGDTDPTPSGHRYVLSQEIWDELLASVNAGLMLPATRYADEPSATKSHLVLQYPGDGGILFLDAVVKKLAATLGTNVVTINAQDIAEMYGEQDQDVDGSSGPLSLLGFEVYHPSSKSVPKEEEDLEDVDEAEADEDTGLFSKQGKSISMSGKFTGDSTSSIIQQLFGGGGGRGSVGVARILIPQSTDRKLSIDRAEELRCYRLIDRLLSVSRQNRSEPAVPSEDAAKRKEQPPSTPSDLVIQIQDYKELLNSRGGTSFMTLLHQAVQDKRRDGHRIIILGTVSSNETDGLTGKAAFKTLPSDYDRYSKTIVVTPAMSSETVDKIFEEDSKKRILEINIRHLQQVLKTRLKEPKEAERNLLNDRSWPLDAAMVRSAGLDNGYWPFDQIHRIVTLALGSAKGAEHLDLQHLQKGMELVEKSDKVKSDWYSRRSNTKSKQPGFKSGSSKARKLKLRSKCNSYEEKLLNGVVDAESIHTTFSDVHVPGETIEALKTLTTLSLLRPEEFKYGVLATDKIPGLLLYGPPGTGKTLLAKAVARESGATVLEVSGSDVYDMYVGEGEKNVRAIFTLAKKLSPCVVFIDEADAIFCSRTGGHNRPSHRELINQFLREWDGMDDMSAFIMVATNRPFDLDDAVLRRLPRRLLVDLPTEEARLAILKIHLKNEQLDPSIDLAELARRTPFYSGSDLKNLAVSAALACVRQEQEKASRHEGDEPYKFPERRTLQKEHFEKALDEISASISEDMSSLTAIRKFDEKYGDRKGRRKKSLGWGFTHPSDAESSLETGRVRN